MKLDQIGFWSEIKIEIIKQFTSAYRKKRGLEHYLLAEGRKFPLWRENANDNNF